MKKKVESIESSPIPMQTTPILMSSTPEGRENELIDMAYNEFLAKLYSY